MEEDPLLHLARPLRLPPMDPCSESPVGIARNHNAPSSSSGPWRALRCDVYLGFFGSGDDPAARRLVAWAELEAQGIACFAACRGGAAREAAMGAASLGVAVVCEGSLLSPCIVEEMLMFSERGNLVPLFFGLSKEDCAVSMKYSGAEKRLADAQREIYGTAYSMRSSSSDCV